MRKKVLLITNERGGWGTVGDELYKLLSKSEKIDVLTKDTDPDTSRIRLIKSVNHFIEKKDHFSFVGLLGDYRGCSKELEKGEYDTIICNIERYLPLASLLKKKLGAKRLVQIGHGTFIYCPFVEHMFSFYNKYFMNNVDEVVVPSDFTLRKVKKWYKGHISVTPWAVDTKKYYPIDVKKEKSFVFVGRAQERKGLSYLLKAFSRLVKKETELKLYVVAKELSDFYQELVRKLNIEKNIIITGKLSHEDLLKHYSKSIAHVLPSVNLKDDFEGFGLVHLEANACGIPTIGSSDTANDEVIEHGKTGFLCKPKDVDGLYERMKQLLYDESLYKGMCENAIDHAKANSWEKRNSQIKDVLLGRD